MASIILDVLDRFLDVWKFISIIFSFKLFHITTSEMCLYYFIPIKNLLLVWVHIL